MLQSTSSGLPTMLSDRFATDSGLVCSSCSLLIGGTDLELAETALLRGVARDFLSAGETLVVSFALKVAFPAVESPTFVAFVEAFVGGLAGVEVP